MADPDPAHDQLVRLTNGIIEHVGSDPVMQARALFEAVGHLSARGLVSEALWVCGDISWRFRGATSRDIREVVADSIFVQATLYGQVGRLDDELVLYERVLTEFPAAPHTTAITLFNKALRLAQREQTPAALLTYGELIDKYRESTDPAIQLQVVMALVNRAGIIARAGRPDIAVVDCTEVVDRFRSGSGPLRRQWAFGLFNQALFLAQLMRHEEALRAIDEFIVLFAETDDPTLQQALPTAISTRTELHAKLGRTVPGYD